MEQERQVGDKSASCQKIPFTKLLKRKPTPITLIHQGGVRVAITEHHLSGGECRAHQRLDMLRTISKKGIYAYLKELEKKGEIQLGF